jgi:hypothetical protein
MTFSHTASGAKRRDAKTRDLMTAALDTAWTALCLGLAPSEVDRAAMATAIENAVGTGERDFVRLQQKAIDVVGARPLVKAVERRKHLRSVPSTQDEPML